MSATPFDKLIQDGVTRGMVARFSRALDGFGEQLAKELWNDPQFRTQMQTVMRRVGEQALAQLTQGGTDVDATLSRIEARLTVIEAQLQERH